jgi:hypothetical protein
MVSSLKHGHYPQINFFLNIRQMVQYYVICLIFLMGDLL